MSADLDDPMPGFMGDLLPDSLEVIGGSSGYSGKLKLAALAPEWSYSDGKKRVTSLLPPLLSSPSPSLHLLFFSLYAVRKYHEICLMIYLRFL